MRDLIGLLVTNIRRLLHIRPGVQLLLFKGARVLTACFLRIESRRNIRMKTAQFIRINPRRIKIKITDSLLIHLLSKPVLQMQIGSGSIGSIYFWAIRIEYIFHGSGTGSGSGLSSGYHANDSYVRIFFPLLCKLFINNVVFKKLFFLAIASRCVGSDSWSVRSREVSIKNLTDP
jgi:hypothetical protein